MNVVIDKAGTVRRRPGISAAPGIFSGVVNSAGLLGLYRDTNGSVWAVSNEASATVYKVGGGSVSLGNFTRLTRPVFAETGALIVIAAGAAPYKIEKVGDFFSPLANAPTSTHIVANSIRLASNDKDNPEQLKYSGFAQGSSFTGHEEWLGGDAGFVTAEARPGTIVAVAETTSEVFVWKPNCMTLFSPDTSFVYVPVVTTENGIVAPYSLIRRDQAFLWLDHRRRFIASDGRSSEVLSDDIQSDLDGIGTVSDCFGYRVKMRSLDCFAWTFPSEGRTFVWQEGGWSQWSSWLNENWAQFSVTCHAHDPATNVNLVGTSSGKVGALDASVVTDLGDPIQAHVETGYENRETDNRKHCIAVNLAFRRGEAVGSTAPIAFLEYRDVPGPWTVLQVSLGASGDREPVVTLRSLGVYRRRQWRFRFTGTEELVLLKATEEYEILEN